MRQTLYMCSWLGLSVPLPCAALCLMMDITGRVNSHSFVPWLRHRERFPYRSRRRGHRGKMGLWEPRYWDVLLPSSAAKQTIWGPAGLSLGRDLALDPILGSRQYMGLGLTHCRLVRGVFKAKSQNHSGLVLIHTAGTRFCSRTGGVEMHSEPLQVQHVTGRLSPGGKQVFLFGWGLKFSYFLWLSLGRPHGKALRTHPGWGEGNLERTAQPLSLPICKESA